MFLIKADKREVLRLYFEHICVLLLFLVFPGKLSYAVKVNNFGSYRIFAPWIRPISYAFDICHQSGEREILRLYFKHIRVLLLFSVFPGKLSLCSQSK